MLFLIEKATAITNHPYAGDLCAMAGVRPGQVYRSRWAAVRDRAKLNALGQGRFVVRPKQEQAAFERAQRERSAATLLTFGWAHRLFGRARGIVSPSMAR